MMKLTLIQVLFQKRVQAKWFYCFRALGNLMKPSHSFLK